jgi:hypothetical protein
MNKGNYYKLRTKQWLLKKGYQVGFLELTNRIIVRSKDKKGIKNKIIFIKKDQFGADLLAMNKEELIFIQVKFGKKNISTAIKEFTKFKFPSFTKKWIVVWEFRASEPEIIEI